MKKRITAIFLAIVMMATPVFAGEYVQLREAAYDFGWGISWDAENRAVILTDEYGTTLTVYAEWGFIENGRVYVSDSLLQDVVFSFHAPYREAPSGNIHGKLTRITYGENVAYIFGSMHASMPGWFPLHPIAEDAMARADVFAFEFDIPAVEAFSDEELDELYAAMFLPDGLTLEDILPEDVFDAFYANLQTFEILGVTYDNIKNLTPIAVNSGFQFLMFGVFAGLNFELSVDSYVVSVAQERGKTIIGLNCAMHETELFLDIPLEIQEYIFADFPDFATALEYIERLNLAEAYATQDIEALREILAEMYYAAQNPFTEMYYYNMLYVRDNIFANEIARLLRETEEPTTFFVTVGIAHLISGSGGGFLLYNLENMGFELVPLWNEL